MHSKPSPSPNFGRRTPNRRLHRTAAIGIAPWLRCSAMKRVEEIATQALPQGFSFEWTDLAHQQAQRGIPTVAIYAAAVFFVFLAPTAQYESWTIPLSIVFILPMCLLASASGLRLRGMPIDILAQIGFVVLVGLAAKNAILIVEFAKHHKDHEGIAPEEAIGPYPRRHEFYLVLAHCSGCQFRNFSNSANTPIASAILRMSISSSRRFGPRITMPQLAPRSRVKLSSSRSGLIGAGTASFR